MTKTKEKTTPEATDEEAKDDIQSLNAELSAVKAKLRPNLFLTRIHQRSSIDSFLIAYLELTLKYIVETIKEAIV